MVVAFILSFWGCVGAISVRAEEREEESDIEDVAEQNSVTQRQAGGTHVLTYYDTRYNDGLLRVGYFEIDGGTTAMCVCHEMERTDTDRKYINYSSGVWQKIGNEQPGRYITMAGKVLEMSEPAMWKHVLPDR